MKKEANDEMKDNKESDDKHHEEADGNKELYEPVHTEAEGSKESGDVMQETHTKEETPEETKENRE